MNLDDLASFRQIDAQDYYARIEGLPGQLEAAWLAGLEHPLPPMDGLRYILIAGMGGSGIGGDLLATYAQPHCPLPVLIHRDYGLPEWARGPQTLVIASSHSGNTEETLSAFEQGQKRGCRLLAITRGGKLAAAAAEANATLWRFEHDGPPRAAVGFSFGYLLALLQRLSLVPDARRELEEALSAMRRQQEECSAEVAIVKNPAKRLAGQLVGRWVVVAASDYLAPVARRWKGQINELAKAWAQFEFLPEADHNTLAGILNPPERLTQMMALFLQSPSDHPRNRMRSELTRKAFLMEGLNTDFYQAKGGSPLAHIWTTLHFGDYLAFYLAMAYEVDPTPIEPIENFKVSMGT